MTFSVLILAAVLIFLATVFLETNAVRVTVAIPVRPLIEKDWLSEPKDVDNTPASTCASISTFSPSVNIEEVPLSIIVRI